jgi:hypothetical protein
LSDKVKELDTFRDTTSELGRLIFCVMQINTSKLSCMRLWLANCYARGGCSDEDNSSDMEYSSSSSSEEDEYESEGEREDVRDCPDGGSEQNLMRA